MCHMKKTILLSLFILGIIPSMIGQFKWNPKKRCYIDESTLDCTFNTLLTAVPFLQITPDSRSGALGNAGIALSPDVNAMHHNAANLAFIDQDLSIALSYTPWLRALGIDDINLSYLAVTKRIDKLSTAGLALRFFSLGSIEFTDDSGQPLGTGRPREFDITGAYARKLSDNFSASFSAKFIYSNLANGQIVGGQEINAGKSVAVDLGVTYKTPISLAGNKHNLTIAAAATDLGSKISYVKGYSDFLPANLGVAAALDYNLDAYNILTFTLEFNKYLVPTPPLDSTANDYDPDFRSKPLLSGIFGSFSDAQGGFTEELQEVMISGGLEYWYDRQFAVRLGYFYENPFKGGRQFLTTGVGLKYKEYIMDFSYLISTTLFRSPLTNTIRFGLMFNFNTNKDK